MKPRLFTLFFLVLLAGISSKERRKLKIGKASLVTTILNSSQIDYGLGSELLQARQSGILSDYQFIFRLGADGFIKGRDAGGNINIMEEVPETGTGYERISNAERNKYHVNDWAFYDNHAYTGDWELGLWQLAE